MAHLTGLDVHGKICFGPCLGLSLVTPPKVQQLEPENDTFKKGSFSRGAYGFL